MSDDYKTRTQLRQELAAAQQRVAELEAALAQKQSPANGDQPGSLPTDRLLEIAPVIMLVLDPQGKIVWFNPCMETVCGYTLAELRGRDWFDICLPASEQESIRRLFGRAMQGHRTKSNINAVLTAKGNQRIIQWHDITLTDDEGQVEGLLAIGLDITKQLAIEEAVLQYQLELENQVYRRSQALEQLNQTLRQEIIEREKIQADLQATNHLLQTILDHTHIMMAYMDAEFNFLLVNQTYAEADQQPVDFFVGKNHFELYPHQENEAIFRQVVETGQPHFAHAKPFEYAHNPERGVTHWDWNLVPLLDEEGTTTGLVLALLDVTERIQAVEQMQLSQKRFKAQYNGSPIPTYTWRREAGDFVLIDYNHAAEQITQGTVKNILGIKMSALYAGNPQIRADFDRCWAEKRTIQREMFYRFELSKQDKELAVSYVFVPPDLIMVHTVDITERKQAEKQLKASLQEKETLLQEIHHRVKNNLQIISSLLQFQTREIEDEAVIALFEESRARVKSLALIHENLYQSSDLARINFAAYLHNLAASLLASYAPHSRVIDLNLDLDEIFLDLKTSVPCGLITNELISNALLHAFPGQQAQSCLSISLRQQSDDTVLLTVGDNGIGFPAGLQLEQVSSGGLSLVQLLVAQLHATLTVRQETGTTFEISFNPNT